MVRLDAHDLDAVAAVGAGGQGKGRASRGSAVQAQALAIAQAYLDEVANGGASAAIGIENAFVQRTNKDLGCA